jgi:hypothetical protein
MAIREPNDEFPPLVDAVDASTGTPPEPTVTVYSPTETGKEELCTIPPAPPPPLPAVPPVAPPAPPATIRTSTDPAVVTLKIPLLVNV